VSGIERFDQAAATWDLTDRRVLLVRAVAEAIASRVRLSPVLKVLDFGCGTGLVTLADLDAEDGSFHEDSAGVHHQGFPRDQVMAWLEETGFQEVQLETATTTRKGEKDYSVFLATARWA